MDLMKFLQWIDYVHSFWQEYVSRGCIHTDKMVMCANNSLLRDKALKIVMSSLSSLLPVSALSIKVGFVVWLLHLGWFSPVVAGLAAGWRSCASHASASRAVKTRHRSRTSVCYQQYCLKPSLGVRGQAFYVQQGASR